MNPVRRAEKIVRDRVASATGLIPVWAWALALAAVVGAGAGVLSVSAYARLSDVERPVAIPSEPGGGD